MDPKTSQLDPKIKEIYDRVMNTPTKPLTNNPLNPLTPPTSPLPVIKPESRPFPQPQTVPPAEDFKQQLNPRSDKKINSSLFVAGQTKNFPQPAIGNQDTETVKKRGFSPFVIILGIIVFFAVYAFVWIKFFHLSLPFLPF